jgi:hypothetical protein
VSVINNRLHLIVRQPIPADQCFVPVGVVSKDYVLVQHREVLDAVVQALSANGISPPDVAAELWMSEYGERLELSVFLPDRFAFDPGDGHAMALRLECRNSVEGSTRFRVLMGWFRFICSNGMVVGITQADASRRHVGDVDCTDIGRVLASGLLEADAERSNLRCWRQAALNHQQVADWANEVVRRRWGFKAATRTFHVFRSGYDVTIAGQYAKHLPSTIAVRPLKRVPGAAIPGRTYFDVSQALAWVARTRSDLQQRLDWREMIPDLMHRLN